jgi:hypothetical protein
VIHAAFSRVLVALALFACAPFVFGQDQSAALAADTAKEKHYGLRDILDGTRPIEERRAALAQFDKEAIGGGRFQQYVVGSLYRVGDQIPDALVKQDNDKAARYLSTAAAHGQVWAMAKMAEIELANKRGFEAMIWAQMYAHYTLEPKLDKEKKDLSAGYFGDLLHRIYEHFDEKRLPEVTEKLKNFIAMHGDDIRQGMQSAADEYESGNIQEKPKKLHFVPSVTEQPQHHKDCYADYLIEFGSDGHAKQAWILDALPDVRVGKDLRTVAMRIRVNPSEDSEQSRFAVVPLDFTFGKYVVH